MWEQHGGSREWPALDNPGGCGSPNHAEVYHYNPNLVSDVKWPQYYDNKLLITEYCRNWVKEVQFDNGNPATGNPTIIEPVLAGHAVRAPDRHGVRPGRLALHARVRQRLLLR